MKRHTLFILAVLSAVSVFAQKTIDLSGDWNIEFTDNRQNLIKTTIKLPGSMLTNGLGNDVSVKTQWVGSLYDSSYFHNPAMEKYRVEGKMKFPFFLTPKKHFVGNAKYSRKIFVPESWKGSDVLLYLERPHIETTVYVNGEVAGRDSSLSVPHEFNITPLVKFGEENDLCINIYNGIENVCVGQDSHSVTDQTQGDWNGIVGRMELQCQPSVYIKNVQVFPNVETKEVRVDVYTNIDQTKARDYKARELVVMLKDTVFRFPVEANLVSDRENGVISKTIKLDKIKLWDEFTPNLYNMAVVYGKSTFKTQFGFRDIKTDGRRMMLNGHEIFIRGTVGNCCFPNTGYPPTDVESWLNIFKKCKEYGLNMMRFHSYCPPEAAFTAADLVGFYLQPEGPSWPNHGVKLGNKMTIDRYLLEETQRMVEKYGNHPSFIFLAAGNEPAGNWVKWVGDFVDYWHSTGDNRRLYCGASVGGGWAFDPKSDYHVKGGARGLDWDRRAPQTMDDFSAQVTQFVQKGRTPITFDINEPYLSHEQGQWCCFPDFKEIEQYTGAYKAGNFEIFRDLLKDNGMESQAEKFLNASGNLQVLAYKFETERNLRTPNYTGFQYLGLNDYSGQGTALVGPLNVFWKEKSYVEDKQDFKKNWLNSCNSAVVLARIPKFVYTEKDTICIDVDFYNATNKPVHGNFGWMMYDANSKDGTHVLGLPTFLGTRDLPIGKTNNIDKVMISVSKLIDNIGGTLDKPTKIALEVHFGDSQKALYYNSYDLWIYPSETQYPKLAKNVYVCDTLDAKAMKVLKKGGKVLLTAAGRVTMGDDVKQTYLPVFWNTSWFKMRPPHTTGAYIEKEHPLFKNFPTDDWGNLNWWELLNKAQVINLQDFPKDYQPAIQPIDTWHVSRKLGMLAEVNIEGGGKLLITTMDISNNLDQRPVARQMQKALLEYVNSDDFKPQFTVNIQVIKDLYTKRAKPVNMFTNDSPDELKPKLK